METLNIIKLGGAVIENDSMLDEFLKSFASLGQKKILVHGGGLVATEIGNKLGLEAKKIEGRRITDADYLEVVTMVYGGLLNKKIVAKLQSHGCMALGLTGADGDYLRSMKRQPMKGVDFGFVGDPVNTRTFFLHKLVEDKIVPVAAPLTHDGNGQLLNTNADTIASTIAAAMSENYQVNLIYAFELEGVMEDLNDSSSLLQSLDMKTYTKLKNEKLIFDGMIPKLDNAFDAIAKGAHSVKIVKYNCIDKLDNPGFNQYTNIQS